VVDQHLIDVMKKLQAESKQRKFLESVELAINLKDIDLTNPKNRLQEEIILPNGRGKQVKVGVFGSSEMAVKAKGVADVVVQPEEIEALASDKAKARKFARQGDFFLAEAPLMPTIGKRLGVVLGPKDMPPEKLAENLDAVLKRLISKLERGKQNIQSAYVKTTMGPSYKVM
jgi:large subunit ribosomal protein L1